MRYKSILITELQVPGKRKMNIKDFINGIKKEDYLGKIFKRDGASIFSNVELLLS